MDEQINTAIDMMITMVIEELCEDLHKDEDIMFEQFLKSKTGKLLYDEKSKLWWSGPSDIAQMYKNEISA